MFLFSCRQPRAEIFAAANAAAAISQVSFARGCVSHLMSVLGAPGEHTKAEINLEIVSEFNE